MNIAEFDKLPSSEQFSTLTEFYNDRDYKSITGITMSWTDGIHEDVPGVGLLRAPTPRDQKMAAAHPGNQKYFKFLQLIAFKVINEVKGNVLKNNREYLNYSTFNIIHILQENATGGSYYINPRRHNKLYNLLIEYKDIFTHTPGTITLSDSQLLQLLLFLDKDIAVAPPAYKEEEPVQVAEAPPAYKEEEPVQVAVAPDGPPLKRPLSRDGNTQDYKRRAGGKKTKRTKKTLHRDRINLPPKLGTQRRGGSVGEFTESVHPHCGKMRKKQGHFLVKNTKKMKKRKGTKRTKKRKGKRETKINKSRKSKEYKKRTKIRKKFI